MSKMRSKIKQTASSFRLKFYFIKSTAERSLKSQVKTSVKSASSRQVLDASGIMTDLINLLIYDHITTITNTLLCNTQS